MKWKLLETVTEQHSKIELKHCISIVLIFWRLAILYVCKIAVVLRALSCDSSVSIGVCAIVTHLTEKILLDNMQKKHQ